MAKAKVKEVSRTCVVLTLSEEEASFIAEVMAQVEVDEGAGEIAQSIYSALDAVTWINDHDFEVEVGDDKIVVTKS